VARAKDADRADSRGAGRRPLRLEAHPTRGTLREVTTLLGLWITPRWLWTTRLPLWTSVRLVWMPGDAGRAPVHRQPAVPDAASPLVHRPSAPACSWSRPTIPSSAPPTATTAALLRH